MERLKDFSKRYLDLLITEFSGINLTRILEEEDFFNKQILDSVLPFDESLVFKKSFLKNPLYLDVGFGGGFPLLPLMFHVEQKPICIGIESKKKKCDVVSEIGLKLGLNPLFIHSRIENILIDLPSTITFKAVGKVYDFLSKLNIINTKVQVFFYKGPGFYDIEKDQIELAKKQWEVIEEKKINVPNADERIIIGFQNKIIVPRGTMTKDMIKLSEFTKNR